MDIQERVEQYLQNVHNASNVGAVIIYEVFKLLDSLGYSVQEKDNWLIGNCIQTVTEQIRNSCNVSNIPRGLTMAAVRLTVADFLTAKMGMNDTKGFENLNFDSAISELKEGDTDIRWSPYAEQTPVSRMNNFIRLLRKSTDDFVTYRRIKW